MIHIKDAVEEAITKAKERHMTGEHGARAKKWGFKKNKKGDEEIWVLFTLDAGEDVFWRGNFSEKGLKHTVKALRAMGWKGDDLSNLAGLDTNHVDLVLEEREWNGEVKTEVKWVNSAGGGMHVSASMPGESLASFAAEMKGRIQALDKEQAAAKAARAKSKKAIDPEDADPIPF